MLIAYDHAPRTATLFGEGVFGRLGATAKSLGFRSTLLVSDRGITMSGIVAAAEKSLRDQGIAVAAFDDFDSNPDTALVNRAARFAQPLGIDSIVGLGGGSSMDLAKGVNYILTNGGEIKDYVGYGKSTKPMLPMIGVPTTAGTGSEAQSYCIIADAASHMKMACGDPQLAFRAAILDPVLTLTQPASVSAATGYDALSHAVESFVSTRRTNWSRMLAREAFRLIDGSFERILAVPGDLHCRGAMLLGAHYAGMAIEGSMLGAAHACANPLTAHFDTVHGVAIAMLLRHVVRWNANHADYRELHPDLPSRLGDLATAAGMPASLRAAGIDPGLFETMANEAGLQWTGKHNPRPLDPAGALEIYRCAY